MRNRHFPLATSNLLFVGLLVLLLLPVSEAQTIPYKVTTLPTLSGTGTYTSNIGVAINNAGQVVGNSPAVGTQSDVVIWTPGKPIEDLGVPGNVFALNNLGHVAGVGPSGAFFWTPEAGFQTFGANTYLVEGLNDLDQIAGSYDPLSNFPEGHAFLWTAATPPEFQDLGVLETQYKNGNSQGNGVNNLGQVVGRAQTNNKNRYVGFLWSNSTGMQATTLDTALGINNQSQVLGSIDTSGSPGHAAIWTQANGTTDLGVLPGGAWSIPKQINNHGVVIGTARAADGKDYVFLWSPSQGMVNVNTLCKRAGSTWSPAGINDAGQILMSDSLILTPIISLAVSSSANPSTLGQPVTFTATASSIAGPPPDGEIVSFRMGGTVLGTAPLANGTATLTTSTLKAGSHAISGTYPGDVNYASSKSKALTQVVDK
jgi:probable HAF family extracellular repeat protein